MNPSISIESLQQTSNVVEIAAKFKADLSFLHQRNHQLKTDRSNLECLFVSLEDEGNLTTGQKQVYKQLKLNFENFLFDIEALANFYADANRIINPPKIPVKVEDYNQDND